MSWTFGQIPAEWKVRVEFALFRYFVQSFFFFFLPNIGRVITWRKNHLNEKLRKKKKISQNIIHKHKHSLRGARTRLAKLTSEICFAYCAWFNNKFIVVFCSVKWLVRKNYDFEPSHSRTISTLVYHPQYHSCSAYH